MNIAVVFIILAAYILAAIATDNTIKADNNPIKIQLYFLRILSPLKFMYHYIFNTMRLHGVSFINFLSILFRFLITDGTHRGLYPTMLNYLFLFSLRKQLLYLPLQTFFLPVCFDLR